MSKPLKIVASIEARMGSSRLPGKMMQDIEGKPAIIRLLERLKRSSMLDDIILATTTSTKDDTLAKYVQNAGFKVFRGSEDDVLARVVGAHTTLNSDVIVEITGDCTLLDPDVIDMGIYTYLNNSCDVVSNTSKLSFPQGVDVQVFSFDRLSWIAENIDDKAVREHVSLYFYENENTYKIIHLQAPPCWRSPNLRCQLDYPEDLEFIRAVYAHFTKNNLPEFGVQHIIDLVKARPDIAQINAFCEEKTVR